MRKLLTLILGLALFSPGSLRAGEPDAVTAELPAGTHLVIHVRSIDRVDMVAKAIAPLVKMFGPAEGAMLENVKVSDLFQKETGVDLAIVDRAKPIYLALVNPGSKSPLVVAHPQGRFDGEKNLPEGMVAKTRGAALVVAQRADLELAGRGTPVPIVAGDVGVHVFVSHLTTKYKDQIDQGFGQVAMQAAAQGDLPDPIRKLVTEVVSASKNIVNATESIDYALTWDNGDALAEGLIRFKDDSGVRKVLRRAGKGGGSDLLGYLPTNALLTVDSRTPPDMMMNEFGAMLDRAFGEGKGKALLKLMNAGGAVTDSLTGETVASISMQGMSGSTVTLARLKPGVDPAKMFETYDIKGANEAFTQLEIPIKLKLEKNFAKHGETALHRVTFESENFQIAVLAANLTTFICAENGVLFSVQSPTAEEDLAGLLDRFRKGEKKENAHMRAMAKLGPNRHMGITFNATALKDVLAMVAMFVPQAGAVANAIPDDFAFSTAMTLKDGNLHWRGNWPVKKIATVVKAVMGGVAEPKEEEFD